MRIALLTTLLAGAAQACDEADYSPNRPASTSVAAEKLGRATIDRRNPLIEELIDQINSAELGHDLLEFTEMWHSRNSGSDDIHETYEFLMDAYHEFEFFDVYSHDYHDSYPPNVCAELPGNDPSAGMIVMGAHYDSRAENINDPTMLAPGADDNGTGTVALYNIAKAMNSTGTRFERTIQLCSFSGEEQGLLGSRALAEDYAEAEVDVFLMVNADMLGWKLPNEPVTVGFKDRFISNSFTDLAKQTSTLYTGAPTADSSSCCSDYMSFYENGYDSVGFFENSASASANPYYHKTTDTAATVHMEQYENHARAFAAFMAEMAVPSV